MSLWRHDYPILVLEEVQVLREDPPTVPPAHVYIVTTKDLEDMEEPDFEVEGVYHLLQEANEKAMNIFKKNYMLWFMQAPNFENWVRGRGVREGFGHVVNWDLDEDEGGIWLQAWAESESGKKGEPKHMRMVFSVEVGYERIRDL